MGAGAELDGRRRGRGSASQAATAVGLRGRQLDDGLMVAAVITERALGADEEVACRS
jgi:hypothetical protein